jgi:hypothetical protein
MVWALKEAPVPNDPVAHLVLIAYADHAQDDGTAAWPSVARVASYARCTPRTVQTKIRLLLDWGLMRRGDQRLVSHKPPNRRPVVYDLVMDAEAHLEPAAGAEPLVDVGDEATGQAGVKILHPRTEAAGAGDNPAAGMKRASPQAIASVDKSTAGVNTGSPQPVENPCTEVKPTSPHKSGWGEAERTSGVKLSSYKPSLEPSIEEQGLPRSGTSPEVIHRPGVGAGLRDRCPRHRDAVIPPPCHDCAATRHAHASEQARTPDPCPDGDPRGASYCALCRQRATPAPWDAAAAADRSVTGT